MELILIVSTLAIVWLKARLEEIRNTAIIVFTSILNRVFIHCDQRYILKNNLHLFFAKTSATLLLLLAVKLRFMAGYFWYSIRT
jgi:hypothetical protein